MYRIHKGSNMCIRAEQALLAVRNKGAVCFCHTISTFHDFVSVYYQSYQRWMLLPIRVAVLVVSLTPSTRRRYRGMRSDRLPDMHEEFHNHIQLNSSIFTMHSQHLDTHSISSVSYQK